MASVITNDGATRLSELAGNEDALVIDTMVLAMVPGLDTSVADPDQQLPDAGYIVHTYSIPEDYKGYVDPNQVVYSMILGTDLGDFEFNWVGLVEAVTGIVIAVTVTPAASKWATNLATNTVGNNITRNLILSYQDAQNLTGITVAAETWQFDYQADLNTHISLAVDPTSSDDTTLKHLYDYQAKYWQDHVNYVDLHRSGKPGDFIFLPYQPSAEQMLERKILLCNGGSVLDEDYPDILTAWGGKIFGNVDDTHFNLPALCGYFPRFWDNSAGIDPDASSRTDRGDGTTGDAVGTKELDGFKAHRHPVDGGGYLGFYSGSTVSLNTMSGASVGSYLHWGDGVASSGGTETRPKNIFIWGGIFY